MTDQKVRDAIASALGLISLEHNVEILHACEAGSRAWGFESRDSDYDVRFIYASRRDWYLDINSCSKRDVIDGVMLDWKHEKLDISGWDLRKALGLFRKGNPPLMEHLRSPVVYVDRYRLAERLRRISEDSLDLNKMRYHYGHMALNNQLKYLGGTTVKLKKYLYVLRPMCAVKWIDVNRSAPPVRFRELLSEIDIPLAVRDEISLLIEKKRAGMELGVGERNPVFDMWIGAQLESSSVYSKATNEDPIDILNILFREILEEFE